MHTQCDDGDKSNANVVAGSLKDQKPIITEQQQKVELVFDFDSLNTMPECIENAKSAGIC